MTDTTAVTASPLSRALPCAGADEPVRALTRHALSEDFRYWRGASGKRYLHKVYPLREWPGFELANVLFVRRDGGERQVLWVGQTGSVGGLPRDPGVLARIAALGANEVHVHLLGETETQRNAAEQDLKAASKPLPDAG